MPRWFNAVFLLVVALTCALTVEAATSGSITITGAEQSSGGIWDHGTVTVTVNGYPETVPYGQYSTTATIASALAAKFSMDCSSPVNARATGAVITFQARGTNTLDSVDVQGTTSDPGHFAQASFDGSTLSTWATAHIVGLTPNSGATGTVVTISGVNFGTAQGSSTLTLNGTAVSPLSWDTGTIVFAVPSGATTGNVVVTVGGVASNGVSFTVNSGSCQF